MGETRDPLEEIQEILKECQVIRKNIQQRQKKRRGFLDRIERELKTALERSS